jgi:D-alanine-D-alanine ligase and related ATP-grasp enzymes
MIIKPSNLGSSIGIRRAENRDDLENALEIASAFDGKILVEYALSGFTELNCAVFSDGETLSVSDVEEPVSWNEYLTF